MRERKERSADEGKEWWQIDEEKASPQLLPLSISPVSGQQDAEKP